MKTILSLILIHALPVLAHADVVVRGIVDHAPATIAVRAENGSIKIYKTPVTSQKISFAAESGRSANKSFKLVWGRTSTLIFDKGCGTPSDYLGQLISPITLHVRDDQGLTETVNVTEATSGPGGTNFTPGNVRVYGNCKDLADQLTGMSISTTLTNAKLQ